MGTVIGIALLHVLIGLPLLPLFTLLLGFTILTRAARPSQDAT